MHPFELIRATDVPQALQKAANGSAAQSVRFVAGGTTLIDLMKLDVERPRRVIDINGLPLNKIEFLPEGGLKVGALVRNSDFAHHPNVLLTYGILLQAVWGNAGYAKPEYVRIFIGQLRKKLEADPSHPRYLVTEAWMGYRFHPHG